VIFFDSNCAKCVHSLLHGAESTDAIHYNHANYFVLNEC